MSERKGIVLAAGSGTRLSPATRVLSKQLLPVWDRPMVYYPIATLMQAGIREILVIVTPADRALFERLLGDGSQWGIALEYDVQPSPAGIAQAFLIAKERIKGCASCLALGDNLFYGEGMDGALARAAARRRGATVLAYAVGDPSRYGVVELDAAGAPVSLEEKPLAPRSPLAVTGLYFYDESVVDVVGRLQPSPRGELEITDVNRAYLAAGQLAVDVLDPGVTWFDMGTHASLLDASSAVASTERASGAKVACPEEIAWRRGWIDADALARLAAGMEKSAYGAYLAALLAGA